MDTTSPSLIERLRRPADRAAWDCFADIYTPILFAWAHRLGLDADGAADLVQDVFLLTMQKFHDYEQQPGKQFRGWLWTVFVNKWREGQRRRRPDGPLLHDVADHNPSDPFWEAEYRRHLVGRALRIMEVDFEPATWKACWECVVNDRPPAEVAAELGITVNAVYHAKSRILRRLHQELAGLWE